MQFNMNLDSCLHTTAHLLSLLAVPPMQGTHSNTGGVWVFFEPEAVVLGLLLLLHFHILSILLHLRVKYMLQKRRKNFLMWSQNSTAKTFGKCLSETRTYLQNLAFQADYMITNSEEWLLFNYFSTCNSKRKQIL